MTSKKDKGLFGKFRVARTDGSSEPGKKHARCSYFVLDLNHDPFAVPALRAYAEACVDEYPLLATDLENTADGIERDIKSGLHPSCGPAQPEV